MRYVLHGLCGARRGACSTVLENRVDLVRMRLEVAAAFLDGRERPDDGVGQPALALDAADAGGRAAFARLLLRLLGREDFVQVEDRADIGVAGVGAADARRVGDHRLELGANLRLGVGEQDGVVVALGHLAAIGAGQLGRGRQQDFRLGQKLFA